MSLVLRDELYKIVFFFQDCRGKYIPSVPNFQMCSELHLKVIKNFEDVILCSNIESRCMKTKVLCLLKPSKQSL